MIKKALFIGLLLFTSSTVFSAVWYNFSNGQVFKIKGIEVGYNGISIEEDLNKGDKFEPFTCYITREWGDVSNLVDVTLSYDWSVGSNDFGKTNRVIYGEYGNEVLHICFNSFKGISADKNTKVIFNFSKTDFPASHELMDIKCVQKIADPDNYGCN